jgi:hypothetical protein
MVPFSTVSIGGSINLHQYLVVLMLYICIACHLVTANRYFDKM